LSLQNIGFDPFKWPLRQFHQQRRLIAVAGPAVAIQFDMRHNIESPFSPNHEPEKSYCQILRSAHRSLFTQARLSELSNQLQPCWSNQYQFLSETGDRTKTKKSPGQWSGL
jgi:hypothetical protein